MVLDFDALISAYDSDLKKMTLFFFVHMFLRFKWPAKCLRFSSPMPSQLGETPKKPRLQRRRGKLGIYKVLPELEFGQCDVAESRSETLMTRLGIWSQVLEHKGVSKLSLVKKNLGRWCRQYLGTGELQWLVPWWWPCESDSINDMQPPKM